MMKPSFTCLRNATQTSVIGALTIALLLLWSGCTAMSQALSPLFTAAEYSDMEVSGAAGQLIGWTPTTASVQGGPVAGAATQQLLDGLVDPLGYILPVTPINGDQPFQVLCSPGEQAKLCHDVPKGALVTVTGKPFGTSAFFVFHRLTWRIR